MKEMRSLSNIIKYQHITYSEQTYTMPVGRQQMIDQQIAQAKTTQMNQLNNLQANQQNAERRAFTQEIQKQKQLLIEQARQEAQNIILKAKVDAQKIKQEAQAEVQQMYQAAYIQGKQQAELDCAEYVKEAQTLVRDAVQQKEAMLEQYQEDILGIITQVVDKFMDNKLKTDEYARASIYKHATTQLLKQDEHIIKVRVSDQLFNFGSIKELGVEIVQDRGLSIDECIIETTHGDVDAGIASQKAHIMRGLNQIAG